MTKTLSEKRWELFKCEVRGDCKFTEKEEIDFRWFAENMWLRAEPPYDIERAIRVKETIDGMYVKYCGKEVVK